MTCRALHREDLHRYQMTPSTQASTAHPLPSSQTSRERVAESVSRTVLWHTVNTESPTLRQHPRGRDGVKHRMSTTRRGPQNQDARSKSKDGRSNTNTTSHVRGTHARNRNCRIRTRAHAHHSSSIVGRDAGAPRLRHRLGRHLYFGSSHA